MGSLQKLWVRDCTRADVEYATRRAKAFTQAWNKTTDGILRAAKAVAEVRQRIGGRGSGTFGKWAEEEIEFSHPTASQLANIGDRFEEFVAMATNLPPSWRALAVIAAVDNKRKRKAVLSRVSPEMTRREVQGVIDRLSKPSGEIVTRREDQRRQEEYERQRDEHFERKQFIAKRTTPDDGARVKEMLTVLKGAIGDAESALESLELKVDRVRKGALSPEGSRFVCAKLKGLSERIDSLAESVAGLTQE